MQAVAVAADDDGNRGEELGEPHRAGAGRSTGARKARDADRVTALGGLLAALQEAEVQARGTLSEQDEIALLRRERKRREEGAASFREGGREDDARKEEAEAELIGALPAGRARTPASWPRSSMPRSPRRARRRRASWVP